VFEDHGRVSCHCLVRKAAIANMTSSLGLTKTGQGARIEAFYRVVPSYTVPGGSEDVLIDLGVREALKLHKQAEKMRAKL
jgi:hypothetical protein